MRNLSPFYFFLFFPPTKNRGLFFFFVASFFLPEKNYFFPPSLFVDVGGKIKGEICPFTFFPPPPPSHRWRSLSLVLFFLFFLPLGSRGPFHLFPCVIVQGTRFSPLFPLPPLFPADERYHVPAARRRGRDRSPPPPPPSFVFGANSVFFFSGAKEK